MDIIHACPANCATGGPEAIHEFVSELNKVNGVNARIWYWNAMSGNPQPEEYAAYNCDYITELPENYSGVVIVPEIWANRVVRYRNCKRAIYWLGVDAYASWTPDPERGDFLKDDSIIHIAQSEYALDFLKKLGVKRTVKCTDMLNADFYEDYEEENRGNVVLYNPAKATPFMHKLMAACRGIEFRPIRGMTRAEIIDAMRHSKLYIDFGEFPGRERLPREAALCGCCLITSRIGSAAYDGDFLHDYKFESKLSHIWAIKRKIRYVLDHYDECRKDFEPFRRLLRFDRDNLYKQVSDVVTELKK